MTKFIIRRLIQSIPTIIGISIIVYAIMDLIPGNPLSQITQDPNLTVEDRRAIFDAYGFNDPVYIKYARWLIGDAPITFGNDPSWAVELDNGQTVIIDSASGEIRDIRETGEMNSNTTDTVVRRRRAGEREITVPMAEEIALESVSDAEIVEVGWLPFYNSFVIWGGRNIPLYDSGQIIGEEVGTDLGILRGDFGTSFASNRSTVDTIAVRIGPTLELGGLSLMIGLLIGIPVGVLAAVWQGSIFDQVTRIGAVVVSSIPVFWLGLMLLLIFGSTLELLPMGNRTPLRFSGEYTIGERLEHLILPVFTLSSFTIATYSRFMRASLLNVLNEDYVRTARAKGLSDRKVWFKHALRNAMIPIATILGPSFTAILAGAVLTETIYSWPGMGRLVVDSVVATDYPVVMGVVLLTAVMTVLGFLISDILYAIFDPRIRLS